MNLLKAIPLLCVGYTALVSAQPRHSDGLLDYSAAPRDHFIFPQPQPPFPMAGENVTTDVFEGQPSTTFIRGDARITITPTTVIVQTPLTRTTWSKDKKGDWKSSMRWRSV